MKAKTRKVDGKLRVGGETEIPHGARGGGVGTHKMSKGVRHIGHVPADDHGVPAGDSKKNRDGE